jgi:hypothetical protein
MTPVTLNHSATMRVCRLQQTRDTVMLWVVHSPLDVTLFVTCSEANRLADTGEAKIVDGGTIRLWAIDGCPGCWVLSIRSRPMESSLHLDTGMVDLFRKALRSEADAVSEGEQPGNGQQQHIGASA